MIENVGTLRWRQFLHRCFARAHGRHNFSTASLTTVATGGERGRRRCGGAGRPYKALRLRDALFEWFCSLRGAVKTRLPLSCLMAQAKAMREKYMRATLKRQAKVKVPQITGVWVAALAAVSSVLAHPEPPLEGITPSVLGEMPHHVAQPIQSSATL